MIVGMYMTRDAEVVSPEASLGEAIRKMSRRRIRRLVVTNKDAIVGMVCHRDLVNAFRSERGGGFSGGIARRGHTQDVATADSSTGGDQQGCHRGHGLPPRPGERVPRPRQSVFSRGGNDRGLG